MSSFLCVLAHNLGECAGPPPCPGVPGRPRPSAGIYAAAQVGQGNVTARCPARPAAAWALGLGDRGLRGPCRGPDWRPEQPFCDQDSRLR